VAITLTWVVGGLSSVPTPKMEEPLAKYQPYPDLVIFLLFINLMILWGPLKK